MKVAASLMKRIESGYSRVLSALFELMLSGGMQRDDVLALSISSLNVAETKARRDKKETSGGLALAALVLAAWHRDRRYLNTKAEPRAVRLLGPAPSVEALIRAENRRRGAADLARRLKSLRLVVSSGRNLFRPSGEIALISAHDPFVLQHIATALSMLLETIDQNLDSGPNSAPLIERFAEIPDLPAECIPAFQKFTKIQGWIFLRTVNDWLETRRARRTSSRTKGSIRAGVHVHAYVARGPDRSLPPRSIRSMT
jgi:hypothetical protein